ncbi:MAG: cytochrome b N-terminal domain-containing protein [Anaerolineae bacterium]
MRSLLRRLDKRLNLQPLLITIRQTRPADYISPLAAPPISPGRLALALTGLLVLSGLGLTLFYEPTAERAASSLAYLHQNQPLGWLLHNSHRWSALLLLVFVILHALRAWLQRVYRYPRDLSWWLGLCLLSLVIILGGTGYLLRWDIKAFTLMDLVISNLSGIPLLGQLLIVLLLGGSQPDVVPLYRGYALHIWFLPLVLVLLVASHLGLVWRQGLSELPQVWRRLQPRLPLKGWWDLLPGLVLLAALVALSAVTPHEGQAGPEDRSAWPHPDWLLMFYFLPFWFFKGQVRLVGALVVPAGLLVFLALAPRLGRNGVQWALAIILAIAGLAGVGWLFAQTSAMGYQVPLQGCTACHRSTIIGGAPTQLSEFKIRDPDWLVFHLRDPRGSLLVPFSWAGPGQRVPPAAP